MVLKFKPVKDETTGVTSNTLKAVHYTVEDIRKELAAMVITNEMPFQTVENEGFKRYGHAKNPKFQLPSRRTVGRDYLGLYVEEINKLKKKFEISTCLSYNRHMVFHSKFELYAFDCSLN